MWIFGYGSLVFKADFPYIKKVVGYVKGYERKFWQASIDHRGIPEKPGRVVTLVPSEDPEHRVYGIAYKIHRKDVDLVIRQLDLREAMGYEKVPATFHPINNHPLNIFDDHHHSTKKAQTTTAANTNYDSDSEGVDGDSGCESMKMKKNASFIKFLEQQSGEHERERQSHHPNSDTDSNSITSGSSDDEGTIDIETMDDYDSNYENVRYGLPFRVSMYFGSETNEHFVGPSTLSQMAMQIYECSGKSGRNREYLFKLAESMREISEDAVDLHLRDLEAAVRSLELQFENMESSITNIMNAAEAKNSVAL